MALYKGKHPATVDTRDRQFEDYVDKAVLPIDDPPPAGSTEGHGDKMPTPRLMLGNGPDPSVAKDFGGAGDCVDAMAVNLLRLAWSISGKGVFPGGGPEAIGAYSETTGYVLNDESTDNGTNMRTFLNWFRKTGLKDRNGTRHKITAFASVKYTNWNHALWAMHLMDTGVPIGVMFPNSGMDQFNNHQPFTVVTHDHADEGHCLLIDWQYKVETWARDQPTDDEGAWIRKWVDEMYIVLDSDGLINGKSIEGFDAQQLVSDVQAGD